MTVPTAESVQRNVAAVLDIMKLTRGRWITRNDMSKHLGARVDSIIPRVREMVAQGLLIERTGTKPEGMGGFAPMEYTLAPQWMGAAVRAEATTIEAT